MSVKRGPDRYLLPKPPAFRNKEVVVVSSIDDRPYKNSNDSDNQVIGG